MGLRFVPLLLIILSSDAWGKDDLKPTEQPKQNKPEENQEITAAENIVVIGEKKRGLDQTLVTEVHHDPAPDTANLVRNVPGGNVASNGPLSGQVWYRGMFGPRVNVMVDGMHIDPGGPNWMDPPLHYLPRPLLDSVEVLRGIAPVSSGAESLGGTVYARSRTSKFTERDEIEFHGNLVMGGRTVDSSLAGGGMVSLANQHHRIEFLGGGDTGGALGFPGGDVTPTEYERLNFRVGYGFKRGGHEFDIDYRRDDTGKMGNPPLPMDALLVAADIFRTGFETTWRDVRFRGTLYLSQVDHEMDNFTLRAQPPGPEMFRLVKADSHGIGYNLEGRVPLSGGVLAFGLDGHRAFHDMDILNPNNPNFFVRNFSDVDRHRKGGFVEWTHRVHRDWSMELGFRYTRVTMAAGPVQVAPMLPMPVLELAEGFNRADRDRSDNNVDAVIKLNYEVSKELIIQLGVGRKTRSPSYLERYAWLPVEVTAGFADGNNYVGDIDLAPEVCGQIELGLELRKERIYVSPRLFYREVDDYIQGTHTTDMTTIMVSRANMDPTPLRWTNVDATFYGIDAEWGVQIDDHLDVKGIVNFVRGKRKDIADDLYRIAPLNAMASFSYRKEPWSISLTGIAAQKQDKVSHTNGEIETAGYCVLNLHGQWMPTETVTLTAGLSNLLDRTHGDHLSGFNRVQDSDVGLGERIPGPGRGFLASLNISF